LARQLVILAGGKGTRLATELGTLPKALADIAGRPLLHRQLDLAAEYDFLDVLVLVQHGAELIREACGGGEKWGLRIDYIEETRPRGTAGAVVGALDCLADQFMVLYGDTVLDVDFSRMMRWHNTLSPDATLLVHPNDHPFDSDLVEIDRQCRVIAFHSKPHPTERDLPNLVNAGLYVFERSALLQAQALPELADFGKHVLPAMLASGADLRGYRSREYIKDAGTPSRLAKVISDLTSGRVARRSLKVLAPAVFIDRDGTINQDPGHISSPDAFKLLPGSGGAIRRLNDSDYLAVVVTNQPVVARGEASEEALRDIHNRMEALLGKASGYLDGIYYCPHHPDSGFPGERPELKGECDCRKPKIGLIEQARTELEISLNQSWFVGDSTVELETARRAGLRSILVRTGQAGRDGKFPQRPDFECRDLAEAASLILDVWPQLAAQAAELMTKVVPGSCVLIGGLARSGKSSLASALAHILRQGGQSAVVMSVDSWLPTPNASLFEPCDLSAVETLIGNVGNETVVVEVPLHDHLTESPALSYSQTINPQDIVILEGVSTLALTASRARRPVYRVFVERNEQARRASLLRDYLERGCAATKFDELYSVQLRDEEVLIPGYRENANSVIMSALT
jgi:D,D-heptose 1,7-bisphosphate phosphatase